MKRKLSSASVLIFASLLMISACNNETNTSATAFESAVVGAGGESGILNISLIDAANSSVKVNDVTDITEITGTVEVASGTVELAGTYNAADNTVTLSGGDYSFSGTTTSAGKISGEYTNAEGVGAFSGFDSTTNTIIVYCGTYTSDNCDAAGCSGTFSITTSSGGLGSGTYLGNDGVPGVLWGRFEGETLSGEDDHSSAITGTVANGVATGIWSIVDENLVTTTGTFEASITACP